MKILDRTKSASPQIPASWLESLWCVEGASRDWLAARAEYQGSPSIYKKEIG
jgi:hypothetical protein